MTEQAIKQVKAFGVNADFIKEVFVIVEKEHPDIIKRAAKIIADRYPEYMEELYLDIERKRTIREVIEKVLLQEVLKDASVQEEDNPTNDL